MPAAEPMTQEIVERLKELLARASPRPWTVYSEPEVGLPPSLFSGTPMESGFGPLEPLRGYDLELVAMAINALPALLSTLTNLTPSGVERIRESVFAGVKEQVEEASHDDSARWMTCSGCYEGVDGHNTHGFPYSEDFGCVVGGGCQECGGIGALWDTTDYAAMAEDMLRADRAALALPSEPPSQGDVEGRALLDFLHTELAVAIAFLGRGPGGTNNGDPAKWGSMCDQIGTSLVEADRRVLAALATKEDGRS